MSQRKPPAPPTFAPTATPLLADLRQLIEEARRSAAVAVNASLTLMYWRIGRRIHAEVLGGERAGYGEEILPTLSAELVPRYGRGFSARNLWRMVQPFRTSRLSPRC